MRSYKEASKVWLVCLFGTLSMGCGDSQTVAEIVAPHIIVLVADDLGVGYAPCLTDSGTMPYLQERCSQSLVFTQAYTNPVCTPSRASMMTGRHTFRTESGDVVSEAFKLGLDEVTVPEAIAWHSVFNYHKAAFGKWHLSSDETGDLANPNLQGFDYFEGNPRQHDTYKYTNYDWFINGEKRPERVTKYKTTHIVDRVLAHFESEHESGPQFYWVGFVNPHLPFHLPPLELHNFDHLEPVDWVSVYREPQAPNEVRINHPAPHVVPYFQAMAQALDTEIGRLASRIEHVSERPVLFIVVGDNGDAGEVTWPEQTGRRGAKAMLLEGGVRVPLMIWGTAADWSNQYAGETDRLTHLVDLFPTLTEIAGVDPRALLASVAEMDGHSFANLIEDRYSGQNPKTIFLQRGNPRRNPFAFGVVTADGYKLILREFERPLADLPNVELLNLNVDPLEEKNLFPQDCATEGARVWSLFRQIRSLINSDPSPYGQPEFELYESHIAEKFAEFGCSALDGTDDEPLTGAFDP